MGRPRNRDKNMASRNPRFLEFWMQDPNESVPTEAMSAVTRARMDDARREFIMRREAELKGSIMDRLDLAAGRTEARIRKALAFCGRTLSAIPRRNMMVRIDNAIMRPLGCGRTQPMPLMPKKVALALAWYAATTIVKA